MLDSEAAETLASAVQQISFTIIMNTGNHNFLSSCKYVAYGVGMWDLMKEANINLAIDARIG